MDYSDYQKNIFDFVKNGKGNLCIVAGAGAGKSTTLRVCTDIIPRSDSVILIAFNKHIVEELKKKVRKGVECSTGHAVGNAAVRTYSRINGIRVELIKDKMFKICSSIVEGLFKDLKYEQRLPIVAEFKDIVEAAQNFLATDIDGYRKAADTMGITVKKDQLFNYIDKALEMTVSQFKSHGYIDFNDMIWLPWKLDMEYPKYDWVLGDEFQDMSALQHYTVSQLLKSKGRIIVVGDPNQAIMAFAGALGDSLDQAIKKFNCTVMPLSICYRCPSSHIAMARHLDNDTLEPRKDAPVGIVDFVSIHDLNRSVRPGDMVMCRLTAPLVGACIRLIAKGVHAKVIGRNIGYRLKSLADDIHAVKSDWNLFGQSINEYEKEAVAAMTAANKSSSSIQSLKDNVDAIKACYFSNTFNKTTIDTFKKAIDSIFDDGNAKVTLCTIHRAKGLEANRTFIIEDIGDKECMPLSRGDMTDDDIEQERHIIYVALTRSKHHLTFVLSDIRTKDRVSIKYGGGLRKDKKAVTERLVLTEAEFINPAPVKFVAPPPDPIDIGNGLMDKQPFAHTEESAAKVTEELFPVEELRSEKPEAPVIKVKMVSYKKPVLNLKRR